MFLETKVYAADLLRELILEANSDPKNTGKTLAEIKVPMEFLTDLQMHPGVAVSASGKKWYWFGVPLSSTKTTKKVSLVFKAPEDVFPSEE
jgi:hypothetical protein